MGDHPRHRRDRASSARTSRGPCVERGDDVRVTVRARSEPGQPRRARRRARRRATSSTAARCAARCAASTASSTSPGSTSLRAGADDAVSRQRRRARGSCWRRRCAPASSASSTPRRSRRSARRARGSTADETQVVPRRAATGCPTSTPSTRPRARRCGSAPRGPAGRHRQPGARARPRRRLPLVDRDRAPLPAPRDPGLRRRRAEHRRRRRTSPAATCWPTSTATVGERYILGNRNFTLDRLFADLGRLSRRRAAGGQAAAARRAGAGARAAEALPGRAGRSPRPRCARRRCGGPSARRRPSASWAGRPATTRSRSSTTIEWYRERERDRVSPRRARASRSALRAAGFGVRARRRAVARGVVTRPMATLYRCRTPDQLAVPVRARRARAAPRAGERGHRGPRPVAPRRPRRGRGAHRPGHGAGARHRRRGDLRLASGSSSTSSGERATSSTPRREKATTRRGSRSPHALGRGAAGLSPVGIEAGKARARNGRGARRSSCATRSSGGPAP